MAYAVLVAGGTAGHINAALALGEYLKNKHYEIQYISGTRYLDKKLFSSTETMFLESRPLRTKNPIILLSNVLKNTLVFCGLISNYLKKRPDFVIGAGGYVCGPSLLAAWCLRVPIFIIEQNAIAGLTNKILAHISTRVFTHFELTKGLEKFKSKTIVASNPTRSNFEVISRNINKEDSPINILVFGGSLGAQQINEAIKDFLNLSCKHQLSVLHQVGKDNAFEIMNKKINYQQLEYIDNMHKAYEWSDIIIARAGASTVSELRYAARPSILIPYPAATDNHQFYNAMEIKNEKNFHVEVLDQKLKGKNWPKRL